MSDNRCPRCVFYAIENARLKAENARLRRLIECVRALAGHYADEAEARMGKGDLPRAAWSYLKAIAITARAVLQATH